MGDDHFHRCAESRGNVLRAAYRWEFGGAPPDDSHRVDLCLGIADRRLARANSSGPTDRNYKSTSGALCLGPPSPRGGDGIGRGSARRQRSRDRALVVVFGGIAWRANRCIAFPCAIGNKKWPKK